MIAELSASTFNDAPHGFRFDDDKPIAPSDYLVMNTLSSGDGEKAKGTRARLESGSQKGYQRSIRPGTWQSQEGRQLDVTRYGNVTRIWHTRLLAKPMQKAGMR
jgi:hypothetical protein